MTSRSRRKKCRTRNNMAGREDITALQDLRRSAGWGIVNDKARAELALLDEELQNINTNNRPLQEIATDYLRIIGRKNGILFCLSIADTKDDD